MKKIFLIFLSVLTLTGCMKQDSDSVMKKVKENIDNSNSYYLEGNLEIINNEESYTYDVKISYLQKSNFKVDLINKTNNHEQIVLKNSDGVYVQTHKSTKLNFI
jgi:outer membrane lipoprotein-sorting protein